MDEAARLRHAAARGLPAGIGGSGRHAAGTAHPPGTAAGRPSSAPGGQTGPTTARAPEDGRAGPGGIPEDVRDDRLWHLALEIERAHRPGPDGLCGRCLPATGYPCWPAGLAEDGKRTARGLPRATPPERHRPAGPLHRTPAPSSRRPALPLALAGGGGHRG